jgi:hypothetical protein
MPNNPSTISPGQNRCRSSPAEAPGVATTLFRAALSYAKGEA